MRINSITVNFCTYKSSQKTERNSFVSPQIIYHSDTFSFTGTTRIKPIKSLKDFKAHAMKRGYPCMYCGVHMRYDEATFLEWKRNNYFSKPIADFVKHFKQYRDSLHESEGQIFDFIEFISRKSPQSKLDTVIKMMSSQANRELLNLQNPIFDSMAVEACKLPEKNKNAVLALIVKSRYRVLRVPHTEEYSGKELRYRIENLSKTLPDEKLAKRVNDLAELLTIPSIYKQKIGRAHV